MTPRFLALVALGLLAGQAGLRALAPLLDEAAAPAAPVVLGFAALAAALGVLWLRAVPQLGRAPAWAWLALGATMRVMWLGAPPVLNTDGWRYLWDGALSAHGLWPWGPPPAAGVPPALGPAGAALAGELRFAHLRSIYPGTAQAGFLLAHLLAPFRLLGLQLVMLAAEAAALLLAWRLLRRAGLPPGRAAIWWCCPLAPVLLVGNAHVDALLVPLLLGALLAALAGRGALAGGALGLAAGVKVWPLLLAPLLARSLPRGAWGPAALALLFTAGLTLAPLLATLRHPDAGLAAYAGQWVVNNAPFAWARAALGMAMERPESLLRPLVALAAAAVALWAAATPAPGPQGLLRRALLVAAAAFYLSPAQYPWYAAWFLPLAALLACRPLLLPAALLPIYWLWFPMDRAGLSGLFNHSLAALHALPVAAWLLWRRR